MQRVGVSTFRSNLSRLLRAVKRGESVEILERDVPIARLVPIPSTESAKSSTLPAWVERLRKKGGARFGHLKRVDLLRPDAGASRRDLGGDRAILEERDQGR